MKPFNVYMNEEDIEALRMIAFSERKSMSIIAREAIVGRINRVRASGKFAKLVRDFTKTALSGGKAKL